LGWAAAHPAHMLKSPLGGGVLSFCRLAIPKIVGFGTTAL